MTTTKYPLTETAVMARYGERFVKAVEEVNEAVAAKQIRNVRHEELRALLSRCFEITEAQLISEPYFYNGRWEKLTDKEQAINASTHGNFASILATMKRLNAAGVSGSEYIGICRTVYAEFAELVNLMNGLKPFIVKGRVPSAAPVVENPNKIVRTCPCCFREIAVDKGGRMVHHGYKRPGNGWQTSSCFGYGYKSYQESSEGTKAILKIAEEALKDRKARLPILKELKEFPYSTFKGGREVTVIVTQETHKGRFFNLRDNAVYELESEIRGLIADIDFFNEKIANWVKAI